METYAICGEHALFFRSGNRLNYDSKAMTISTKIVLECAEEIRQISRRPTTGVYICPNCNNYRFPSVYTLVEPDQRTDLCTDCANRLRADGRHIVGDGTLEIRPKPPNVQVKHSSDEIYQRVIKAEKKIKEEEEKRHWRLRACKLGICPECGGKVKKRNSNSHVGLDPEIFLDYKCEVCPFKIKE